MSRDREYSAPYAEDWPLPMVRIACSRCDRKGQYRKETLAERYPDIPMIDILRRLTADCPHRSKDLWKNECRPFYPDAGSGV